MKYFLILFSLATLLWSCGTRKAALVNSSEQKNQTIQESYTRSTQILYPDGTRVAVAPKNRSTEEASTKLEIKKVASRNEPKAATNPVHAIKFTEIESANVRVPGNNPLPSSGELMLDMNSLQQDFCYPYPGKVISNYGSRGRSMHTGVDIKAVPGDTIRAAMSGVVRMSKYYSGYGNIIVVRHYCGIETVYAHQTKNLVRPNDVVVAGEAIGLAGRTGRATTEHLHFEVRAASEHIDPSKFLDYENMSLRSGALHIRNGGGKLVASNQPYSTPVEIADTPKIEQSAATASTHTVAATKLEPAKAATTKTTSKTISTAKPQTHVVSRGDTLSAISRRYSMSVAELCRLNRIEKDAILSLGQRLKLK